jgi:hypothetical protein
VLAFLPFPLPIIRPDGSRCSIVSIDGSNALIGAVDSFLNAATVLRNGLRQSFAIVQGCLLFPALLTFRLILSPFRHLSVNSGVVIVPICWFSNYIIRRPEREPAGFLLVSDRNRQRGAEVFVR